jgi:hypothetical protein
MPPSGSGRAQGTRGELECHLLRDDAEERLALVEGKVATREARWLQQILERLERPQRLARTHEDAVKRKLEAEP